MPIKPENKHRYPANWKDIRQAILRRAGNQCEGSPAYPNCRAVNYKPHPLTGSRVVLTVAHLDHTPENCHPANLRAWCQKCHSTYDAPHRLRNRKKTKPNPNQLEIPIAIQPNEVVIHTDTRCSQVCIYRGPSKQLPELAAIDRASGGTFANTYQLSRPTHPVRIQRSRRRGWRKPLNTVFVGSRTKWANPFPLDHKHAADLGYDDAYGLCTDLYQEWIYKPEQVALRQDIKTQLKDKHLMDWCPAEKPSHADVMLRIANY